MRRACRTDINQPAIIEEFKRLGASVLNCSRMGYGFPDLIVGYAKRNHLVEIKNAKGQYGRRGLSPMQREWANNWPTPVYVASTVEDVAALLRAWEEAAISC